MGFVFRRSTNLQFNRLSLHQQTVDFYTELFRKRSPSFKTAELAEASADDIYWNLYISGYHRKLVLLIVLLYIALEKIITNTPSLETHSLMLLFKIMYCANPIKEVGPPVNRQLTNLQVALISTIKCTLSASEKTDWVKRIIIHVSTKLNLLRRHKYIRQN